ncbi:MAG: LuxR C-terminal-related transcriptional regulator [Firmicutes bacterium]|nr:LuxR C-terminal-related transcriptional regulator [Bacillota bacterium]
MSNNSVEINMNNSLLTAHYMPRPRIDKMLAQATRGRLVCVVAGAGYGKTQTVRHYMEQQPNSVARWLHLTEADNITSRFWEHLVRTVAFDNPERAAKLREFGFPETLARFKQFADVFENAQYNLHKSFFVLDDFHLIHSKHILKFIERCAHLKIHNLCIFIISRTEPNVNTVSLFAKGRISIITEDELRFTEDEIAEFMQFRGVSFSRNDLIKFSDATKGWAIAIQLLSLVLKRVPGNTGLALDTMKQNIFRLFETEVFEGLPEDVQKTMIKIALVSDVLVVLLHELSGITSFMQSHSQLASFIWFDSLSGNCRVHPLYLEFLQSKHEILSCDEKQDTYHQAAQWCMDNNFYVDAVGFFAKSYQYDRMVEILFSYPLKLPHDTCEYFLKIFTGIEADDENNSVLMLKNYFIPRMLIGTGRYEEAKRLTHDIIQKWEQLDSKIAYRILQVSYSNLAYIDMYDCTVTHKYKAPKYIKKSVEYSKLSPEPPVKAAGPFYVPDVRSYACLVGEGAGLLGVEQFLQASRQAAEYISETHHNMYYGYDDLVACEIAYFKNRLDLAKKHAHQTIIKAREKKQYSIEAMAEQYLLRMALHDGDVQMTREILRQWRSYLVTPNFWNSQLLYDLTICLFYSLIGLPKMSPTWLIMNEKEARTEVHIPVAELIAYLNNCLASKKYNQALTVLYNSSPRQPQHRFLFSELQFPLIAAVAKVKTGDVDGAMEDFARAYTLSCNGIFEMFFIEMGKNLHPLVAAALEQKNCGIPIEWLKKIDRKASIYTKKVAVIKNAFDEDKNTQKIIKLSEREQEVLQDLYYGLSRDEIAENRYLSVNTVKKILQSIYTKLNANNNVDAIRIAIKNKMIE